MTINLKELSAVERTRRADEFNQVCLALMAAPHSPHEAAKMLHLAPTVVETLKAQVAGVDLSTTIGYRKWSRASSQH